MIGRRTWIEPFASVMAEQMEKADAPPPDGSQATKKC